MKRNLVFLFSFFYSFAFAQSLPFSLSIEQVSAPDLPAIHSFAGAQWGDHWLIVAGRVDGLHNLFPNLAFSATEQNNHIFVIDTSTWEVTESSLNSLSYSQRAPLSAVNTEYFQRDHFLYVMGGYGYDSLND